MTAPDVVVIGAGVVGAACAHAAARAGLRVAVLDRGPIAGGTSSAGEGNLLVSDKEPGPELDLTLRSLELWRELGSTLDDFELETKGGLVVAADPGSLDGLRALAAEQRRHGVEVVDLADPTDREPHLTRDLAGGAFYPQDLQVQPMLAAARLLQRARLDHGATVHPGVEVTGIERDGGRITGVLTRGGRIATAAVVNAAGPWAADVAALAGVDLPIAPRRGFILVTEPLPPMIRHKVYAAEYVANVASDDSGLRTSPVVEGTRAGTVLIGSTRERVGFDRTLSLVALGHLARQAVRLFPFLATVRALRAYRGFRPFSPDHLPIIGRDPRVDGLIHACGHEGAGVGLAPATAELVVLALTGEPGPAAFAVERFTGGHE